MSPYQKRPVTVCRIAYRVVVAYFDISLTRFKTLFECRDGYFRSVVREMVERYLDCANPRSGSAGIRCPGGRAISVMPGPVPVPPEQASPGWRELIRKVCEPDPLTCPALGMPASQTRQHFNCSQQLTLCAEHIAPHRIPSIWEKRSISLV